MNTEDLRVAWLMAYLDGEAEAEIIEQIEANPQLLERLRDLAKAQAELTEKLAKLPRPQGLDLGEFHLGLLDGKPHQVFAKYLETHPHSARELETLATFLSNVALPSTNTVTTSSSSNLREQLRIIVAKLTFSGTGDLNPVVAGLRGQAEAIYQAEEMQVILQTDDDPDHLSKFVLTGILLGAEPAGLNAHLWPSASPQVAQIAPLDEFGNFSLAGLSPGTYELFISAADDRFEIHLQAIEI